MAELRSLLVISEFNISEFIPKEMPFILGNGSMKIELIGWDSMIIIITLVTS